MRVGVRLTARLNRTSMAFGRTATVTGQVVPAHRGQGIRLQQKRGRTWQTVQKKALPASGRFYFNLRPRVTGTSGWRIYKASDSDHIGAISQSFRLVVYRATITSPGEPTTAEELLKQADVALYRAKSAGRNQLALAVGQPN